MKICVQCKERKNERNMKSDIQCRVCSRTNNKHYHSPLKYRTLRTNSAQHPIRNVSQNKWDLKTAIINALQNEIYWKHLTIEDFLKTEPPGRTI